MFVRVDDAVVDDNADDTDTDATTASGLTITDRTTEDGCTEVELDAASWAPLSVSFQANGSDPFYHLHDNQIGFYFNVELYTVYGDAWTGQAGTFPTDCGTHGICVYLCPSDTTCYLADGTGSVTLPAPSHSGSSVDAPLDLSFVDLTFRAMPPSTDEACYYAAEVAISW